MGFSDNAFWKKLRRYASIAGRKVVYLALVLYYTLPDPKVPKWVKAEITGALAYFIWPIDVIPDPTPVIGYSDDLAVLLLAFLTVSTYISPENRQKAAAKVEEWFGPGLPNLRGSWVGSSDGVLFPGSGNDLYLELSQVEASVAGSAGPSAEVQWEIRNVRRDVTTLIFDLPLPDVTWTFDMVADDTRMDGRAVRISGDGASVRHKVHLQKTG